MAEEAAAGRPVLKPKVIGRYALFGEIAAGGMATVHIGRLVGPVGFSRTVAIKRLHPQYAKDPEFVTMFLDEARLASRIQHPNVVTTLDVVNLPSEVFLVMEYVHGDSLSRLIRQARQVGELVPPGHVAAVISGMLHGLHAAHEAKSEKREPLHIVHRDVSPQNVLVGVDGTSRVLDFGVAKAALRAQSTRDSQMKGKLGYMSPEQLNAKPVDRRTDLFAAGVVLWEALTGRRLFDGADAGEIFAKVLASEIPDPAKIAPGISRELSRVVLKGLERNPAQRYQTAREFAIDLEAAVPLSTARAVGEWVERIGGAELAARSQLVADVEGTSTTTEDLSRLEAEQAASPSVAPPERPSVISSVQPASGSRPRVPPPPPLVAAPGRVGGKPLSSDPEDRGVGTSTSKVSNLVVPQAVPSAPPVQRKSAAGTWFAALAASAIGGVAAYYLFARQPEPLSPVLAADPLAAALAAPGASPVGSAGLTAAPPPQRAPETVRVEDLPRDLAGSQEGIEVTTEESAEVGGKPTRSRVGRRAAPRPKPATAAKCDPPFTVDDKGIKRPKPGCL